ncbi:MAG TPA: hypothetical protein VHQ90_08125 [Thermoanaerobaculia bacterium]|jgi:hypothetical protein|nr:hypothetical protein [Thermoanaerobaculia bacterium]
MTAPTTTPALQVVFDPTPEIYATDTAGSFNYPLLVAGKAFLASGSYDEVRFVFSIWHPSGQRTIDLDRAYVELRASFDSEEEHWTKIAEIEPVVPPYAGGESFDGWIVLPILGSTTAFALVGSGFEPRARLQIRASAYFVA